MPDALAAAFVGRDRELAALRDAVDAAIGGAGALVLLTGEPGVGKTRLAEEAAGHARGRGMAVRSGRGWEGGGAPAYWPWLQLVRAHVAERDPATLAREVGAGAVDLARLAPELADLLGVPREAAARLDGDQARFRLFDAITAFLGRAARACPLLLVLDDLQWSDVGSAMLLRFLEPELRRAPLLVVGTLRDPDVDTTPALADVLGELRARAVTVALTGLDGAGVAALLSREIGGREAERLAPDVHRRSGGNPLYVTELARLLCAPDRGLGSIPATLRSLIGRRAGRLPAACLELLRLAATIGEEFRLDVLERASGEPRERLLELLDAAVSAHLVRRRPAAPPGAAFVHGVVREVLYDQLSLAERAQAHRRVAEALEGLALADPPLAEIAQHLMHGAPVVADPRAVDYAERAGRLAADQLAYEDAAIQYSRALEALDAIGGDEDRRAALLLALGDARMRAADVDGARRAFGTAAEIARRRDRPQVLARAALGLASGLDGFEVRLVDRAQIDLLEEALDVLGPEDGPVRARLLALLSVALTFSAAAPRRRALADEAVAMARRVADPRALAYALGAYCDASAGPEDSERRLAASSEMIELATGSGDRGIELLGRRLRLVALLETGDIAGVDAEIAAYEATAEALRQPVYLWYVPMWRAMRALMDGRVDECRALNGEIVRRGARAHSENATLCAEILRWNRLRAEGRTREAAAVLRGQLELADGIYGEPFWVGLVAPTEFPGQAAAALGRLVPGDFAELPRDAVFLGCMEGIVDACAVLRDRIAAATAYRILTPYRSRFAVDGTATACYGSVARYLGVLAAVLGRVGEAEAHFEHALAANRRAGAAALVAGTLACYGSMLVETGRAERGEALVRAARATFRELGMDVRAAALDPAGTGSGDGRAARENAFRREGELWSLTFAGVTVRLRDSKGLHDIAALLARPGREVHVFDLVAATDGAAVGPGVPARARGAVTAAGGVRDPLLDARARDAYRERLVELRDELAEAEEFGDVARADRARAEADALTDQLAAAFGLGGRARTAAEPAERARKAVAQRVRNVLRRLDAEHPRLGGHLAHSLRLGAFCSYRPERPTSWTL